MDCLYVFSHQVLHRSILTEIPCCHNSPEPFSWHGLDPMILHTMTFFMAGRLNGMFPFQALSCVISMKIVVHAFLSMHCSWCLSSRHAFLKSLISEFWVCFMQCFLCPWCGSTKEKLLVNFCSWHVSFITSRLFLRWFLFVPCFLWWWCWWWWWRWWWSFLSHVHFRDFGVLGLFYWKGPFAPM